MGRGGGRGTEVEDGGGRREGSEAWREENGDRDEARVTSFFSIFERLAAMRVTCPGVDDCVASYVRWAVPPEQ
jgi:hypothetical protein